MRPQSLFHKSYSLLKKVIEMISTLTGYAGMLAILGAVIIIVYEVIARYLLRLSTIWEVEASIFLIIFLTFVGSAFALKNEAHVSIDVFTELLGPKTRKKLSIVTSISSLAFCVIASIKGWQMWWEAYSLGWRSETLWGPPLAIPYAFLPLGFIFISLQYIVKIVSEVQSLRREERRE